MATGNGEIVTPPWPSPSMGDGHRPDKCELRASRPRATITARLCSNRSMMGFLHAIVQVPALRSCLRCITGKENTRNILDGFHLMGSAIMYLMAAPSCALARRSANATQNNT